MKEACHWTVEKSIVRLATSYQWAVEAVGGLFQALLAFVVPEPDQWTWDNSPVNGL